VVFKLVELIFLAHNLSEQEILSVSGQYQYATAYQDWKVDKREKDKMHEGKILLHQG
jgi:hypothetical protein